MLNRVALALFVVLLSAETAEACRLCGRFGRSCSRVVVKKQVVPSVKYAYHQPQNVTNLSLVNLYPAASTSYQGVSQLYQAYQVNPTLSLELSSRLADKALSNHEASIRLAQEHNSQSLELQRLQLATAHLQAAMGTGQQSSASSLQLNVTQGAGAQQRPLPLGDEELPPPRPGSLLSQKCAQCHGRTLQAPKAGLYIDEGVELDSTQAMRAMQVLNGHDVPEPMHELIGGLTERERCDLMAEITQLWRQ